MITQIFGTKKCKDTQKAIRFFKERKLDFQFIDLTEKGLSQGELNSVKRRIPIDELIDVEGKQYRNRNLQYMKFDIERELLDDPLLIKTPLLRSDWGATVGHQPDVWKTWAAKMKE